MKKLAVIANKNAGKGSAMEALRTAKRQLWGWELDVRVPSSIEELRETCRSLNSKQHEAAIVIGGDGTVNQAIRGLIGTGVPLLPFPGGTANDLANELGLRADWEQVQRLIDRKQTDLIDLVEVNKIPFATIAGVGVGSVLTAEYNERRERSWLFREISKRLQSQVYTLLSAKTVLLRRDYIRDLHIKSDVFDEKVKAAVLFICNQSKLAGDMKVAPSNNNNDKKFSVLLIPRTRSDQLIRALVALKLGKNLPKDFVLFSTDRLVVRDLKRKPVRVFGDGEILTSDSDIEFKVVPKSIRVYRDTKGTGRTSV